VLFEETGEHLADMESMLLALDVAALTDDDLNVILRCAHSIKGGARTFGFSDMAEATHVLEMLLDKIRKHELQSTAPMVDAFLRAGDVIPGQLGAHRGKGAADPEAATARRAMLQQLCDLEAQQRRDVALRATRAESILTICFSAPAD